MTDAVKVTIGDAEAERVLSWDRLRDKVSLLDFDSVTS